MPTKTPTVMEALAKRFASPVFAFLPQVRNGTGWSRKTVRTADALAFSLWPSRGLDLHGIEVKASRGDWKKELANPEKAEDVQQFCDRWWIAAADAKIVAPGELPPTWGLMVLTKRGDMKVIVEAPKLSPKPLDRAMVCSIARKLFEVLDKMIPAEQVQERVIEEAKKIAEFQQSNTVRQLEELREIVADFEEASGVKINVPWRAGRIGAAVKLVQHAGVEGVLLGLRSLEREAARLADGARKALEDYTKAAEEFEHESSRV